MRHHDRSYHFSFDIPEGWHRSWRTYEPFSRCILRFRVVLAKNENTRIRLMVYPSFVVDPKSDIRNKLRCYTNSRRDFVVRNAVETKMVNGIDFHTVEYDQMAARCSQTEFTDQHNVFSLWLRSPLGMDNNDAISDILNTWRFDA